MRIRALLEHRRTIRWVFFLLMAGALWIGIVRRYTVRRLDVETVQAMTPALRVGGQHLIDARPAFVLGRDWIVWWSYREGSLFSRVAGCPGDVFEQEGERWLLRFPDGSRHMLPLGLVLDEGWRGRRLGPEQYFLLNDQLRSPWPDSRQVGPVARADIRARVLFAFGGGSG